MEISGDICTLIKSRVCRIPCFKLNKHKRKLEFIVGDDSEGRQQEMLITGLSASSALFLLCHHHRRYEQLENSPRTCKTIHSNRCQIKS